MCPWIWTRVQVVCLKITELYELYYFLSLYRYAWCQRLRSYRNIINDIVFQVHVSLSKVWNKSENKHYDHVFEVGGNPSVGESTRRRADIA